MFFQGGEMVSRRALCCEAWLMLGNWSTARRCQNDRGAYAEKRVS